MLKWEWDYVFTNFTHCDKSYVYMTNMRTNISVNKNDIELYIKKGYVIGYTKPYTHCRTQKKLSFYIKK